MYFVVLLPLVFAHFCHVSKQKLLVMFWIRLCSDFRSNGVGKLDNRHSLGLRCGRRPPSPPRGHGTTSALRDQEVRTEDRHGRKNEEDGRNAIVFCHRCKKEEDYSGTGRTLSTVVPFET